jgi:type III pantothenate kinase
VLATGGLAGVVVPHCSTVARMEPDLTLIGLRLLWQRSLAGDRSAVSQASRQQL